METIPLQNAQPDTPSSSYAIFKIVGAVIAALVTWIVVATVLTSIKVLLLIGVGVGALIPSLLEFQQPPTEFKAVRLGLVRMQYCPVGDHVTAVHLMRDEDLTPAERLEASRHRDNGVP